MKNQKSLKAAGDFLTQNPVGVAVVAVSAGMDGDAQKDLVLTEARAMVIREYLVENFGFDDSQLKTLGMGKQTGANLDADWGSIQILIFPVGTEVPTDKPEAVVTRSAADAAPPVQATAVGIQSTSFCRQIGEMDDRKPAQSRGSERRSWRTGSWSLLAAGCTVTWRFWVCAFLMAAALAIYVLSGDLAWDSRANALPFQVSV